MNSIYEIDYTRALPPTLKNDKSILALAKPIAEELQKTIHLSRLCTIYARIDELDEDVLDILGYDLHVDWYDCSYPIEAKRRIIKESVKVHKYLGTKYAVETAVGNIFPGSKVEEWFEYGGAVYSFRIIINVSTSGVTAERQNLVLANIRFYKNLRSHLDHIGYQLEGNGSVFVGAFHSIGSVLEIFPYSQEESGGING